MSVYTQDLIKFGNDNNFLVGVCDAEPLDYLKNILNKKVPFINDNINDRIDCKKIFPETKSIIVVAVPYGKQIDFKLDNIKRGKISISAVGLDYHKVVKDKLQKLMDYIELNNYTNINSKIFVDTGKLPERELAKKAGLGFQGKNCTLITEKYGSFVNLGYALVDVFFEPTKKIAFDFSLCGDCNLCQKVCPTNALQKDYICNHFECVSYLTQTKDDISKNLKIKMKNSVYGCDICQNACPFNKNKFIDTIDNIDEIMPSLDFLFSLSNKQFENTYKHTAMFWRGKKTILRNAQIALDNYNLKSENYNHKNV